MGTLKSAPKYAPNGVFERLLTAAELETMTKRQRNQYEAALRNYRDNLADKETTRIRVKRAHEEGLEEGEVIGMQKGETRKALSIARKMRSLGLATEVIAASTGLTEEEVGNLGD